MESNHTIQGVIFDLDGLMVDSEPLAMLAWQQFLVDYGFEMTEEQYKHTIGMSDEETSHYILDLTGISYDPQALAREHRRLTAMNIDEALEPKPGLLPLLETLQGRGYPMAVASNSPVAHVRQAIAKVGIVGYFACVISAEHVTQPKPAPDVYLEAARCLGLDPRRCLALEDSPAGVQAAQAAGMRCLFIPSPDFSKSDIAAVDAPVFASLSACHEALDEILADGWRE
jgi:HAD superfamily hydrolase (TIGR01509 family)